MKIDEELEIFDLIKEELEEIPENLVVNGDINISINITDKEKTLNAKQKRLKVKSPWKGKIKKRDLNKCQCCGETFKNHLEVHHIFPFSKNPELGMNDGNGISLCQKCHRKYHDLYKGQENAVTFAQFLRDFGKRKARLL